MLASSLHEDASMDVLKADLIRFRMQMSSRPISAQVHLHLVALVSSRTFIDHTRAILSFASIEKQKAFNLNRDDNIVY